MTDRNQVLTQKTTAVHSIHALVRLLKSSDGQLLHGLSKIEIAHAAWYDSSFSALNKGEVIGGWLLGALGTTGKGRGQDDNSADNSAVTNEKYWELLRDVLVGPTANARPLKSWLLPILNRTLLSTIITQLLSLRPTAIRHDGSPSHIQAPRILSPARAALSVLWPLAEKRIGIDALTECIGAMMHVCIDWENEVDATEEGVEDRAWICTTVLTSYRNAFGNAGNKRKLYTTFLSTHLAIWLSSLSRLLSDTQPHSPQKRVRDALYAAGTDVLFSTDALKQPLDVFFDAFNAVSSPQVQLDCAPTFLHLLPGLFASHLGAINKNRSTLFPPPPATSSSTSNALGLREEVRKKGMEILGRWWVFLSDAIGGVLRQTKVDVQAWKAIVHLLEIVEKERLFVRSSLGKRVGEGEGEGSSERVLDEIRDLAIEILDARAEEHMELATLAVQILDVLVRIEYDIVGVVLGRVLTVLVSPAVSSIMEGSTSILLTHILEFHTKTRTVDTYALVLLSASSAPGSFAATSTPSGPFPLFFHLFTLSRALRTFLTPSQAAAFGPAVLQIIDDAWIAYCNALSRLDNEDDGGEREAKRCKIAAEGDVTSTDSHRFHEPTALATAFSHTAYVARTLLANLPAQAYDMQSVQEVAENGHQVWQHAGTVCWCMIWFCLGDGRDGQKGSEIRKNMDENVKRKKKRKLGLLDSMGTPSSTAVHTQQTNQIVASAILRLLYDVRARLGGVVASSAPSLGTEDTFREKEVDQLLAIAKDEGTLPELVFEIIRTLLWDIHSTRTAIEQTRTQEIMGVVFDLLTRHFSLTAHWSGHLNALTRENLGLAVLDVLVDRWIDVIDALASKEQLQTLLSVLFSIPFSHLDEELPNGLKDDCGTNEILTPRVVLLSVLQNAQFWELHNVRAAFHSSIVSLTTPLSLTSATPADLVRSSRVYTLLMHVPPEYFTRTFRVELVRRAMGGDTSICALLTRKEGDKNGKWKALRKPSVECANPGVALDRGTHMQGEDIWIRYLTLFRVFLKRMWPFMNVSDHVTSRLYIQHLLNPPPGLSLASALLEEVTIDLVELHIIALLRSQDTAAISSASLVVSDLANTRSFSHPFAQEKWAHSLVQSVVLRIIDCLKNDFPVSDASPSIVVSLRMLHGVLVSALEPRISTFLDNGVGVDGELPASKQIWAWSHVLSFSQWLGVDVKPVPAFALRLAEAMLRNAQNYLGSSCAASETCTSVVALLFEELGCMLGLSCSTHLDVVVALYSVYGGEAGSECQRALEAQISKGSKRLSVDDFSHLFEVLFETIGEPNLQVCRRERLIRLSMVLLHDAPQGTLRIVQNFVTRCLNLFAAHSETYGDSSELRKQYLEFIAKHCSDRPAAVRSIDLGSIWSLLHKVLAGSTAHDDSTDLPIFHHIISIISALVRLRRDLVVHTLPHLGHIFRQLIMITRSLRPGLGAKQSKLVMDSFPSWISLSQSVTANEGRALARLLTVLTIKTVPRIHTQSTTSGDVQKAESIARPFAKHANYVLAAYIDAVNDPLCVMTTEMRRELEPGLFSLCETVGEHSRDALMLSALDSSGKAIMKALWKEYEKQRYVGKG
ncbi:Urb2/Npa2 family-domain-containing protein [Phlebopus sp. FC_14]|nr:Urb2/Npa2 family-domain-containing protein [Phlebopus sp. FC_14]